MNKLVSKLRGNAKFVRRSHMEIMATILSLCRNGPVQKTPIMYRCNLSFKQLQKYLEFLIRTGFLEAKNANGKDFYQITEKGQNFLKEFQNLKNLLDFNLTVSASP